MGILRTIFINRNRQIRSGWKIGLVLACLLTGLVLYQIVSIVSGISDVVADEWSIATPLIFGGSVLFVLWILDHKKPKDIGLTRLKGNFGNLLFGFLLGAVSMTVIFVILLVTGHIALENGFMSPDISMSLLWGLILFILVGIQEELFSRGYCIFVFQQMNCLWVSVLLSSLLFTLLHGLNPHINWIGMLNIFLVGFLFAFMYLKTGNLWMPIGYHISWNYFEGNIFNFPVSGSRFDGLYHIQILRNDIISGGFFGPEGGILTTLVILIGFGVVWKLVAKQEKEDSDILCASASLRE